MGYIQPVIQQSLRPNRRSFIRRFATGLVASSLLGKSWKNPFILEAEAGQFRGGGEIQLRLQDFPVLRNDLGSVRVAVNPIAADSFPDGNFYPVLINHAAGGTFFAMTTRCLHAQCVVEAFDDFEQGMLCPCHGSLYAIDGTAIRGPAREGSRLSQYEVVYDGQDLLTIRVPELAYRVSLLPVGSGPDTRLALSFPTSPNVTYEVFYRRSVNDPGERIPFATSVNGPLDQFTWPGDDLVATVYVSPVGDRGFFEVSMVLLDLG